MQNSQALIDKLLNNDKLRQMVENLTSQALVDYTIEEMVQHGYNHRINQSLYIKDCTDKLLIIESQGSFIIEKKNHQQIAVDINNCFEFYKKMQTDINKQNQFDKNLKIFHSQLISREKNKKYDQNFLNSLDQIFMNLPNQEWKQHLKQNQIEQIFFHNYSLYILKENVQIGDIIGHIIPQNADQFLIVTKPINSFSFNNKSVLYLFKDKVQKILDQQDTFINLFSINDKYKIKQFTRNVEQKTFHNQSVIYKEGEIAKSIYIIGNGEILIKKRIDDKQRKFQNNVKVIAQLTKGCIFGDNDIFNQFRTEYAESILTTCIYQVDAQYFFEFVKHHCQKLFNFLFKKSKFQDQQLVVSQSVQNQQDKQKIILEKPKQIDQNNNIGKQEIVDMQNLMKFKENVLAKSLKFTNNKVMDLQDINLGQLTQDPANHDKFKRLIISRLKQRQKAQNYASQNQNSLKSLNKDFTLQEQLIHKTPIQYSQSVQNLFISDRSLKENQQIKQKSQNNVMELLEIRNNPVYYKTLNSLSQFFSTNRKINIQDYKKLKSQLKQQGVNNQQKMNQFSKFNKILKTSNHNVFRFQQKNQENQNYKLGINSAR